MNPMHGTFRYAHHVFDLFPGETVKVTVTEKNLLLMAVQHIDAGVYFVPQTDKVCHLFRHIPLDDVDFLKASDERCLCWTVWIVMGFKITA